MAEPVIGFLAEDLLTELTEDQAKNASKCFITKNGVPVTMVENIGDGRYYAMPVEATWTGPADMNPELLYDELAKEEENG
jgi:hypothetical protein